MQFARAAIGMMWTHPLFFEIESCDSPDFAAGRIHCEWNIFRDGVEDNGVLALVRVVGVHGADDLVGGALPDAEHVRQADELRVLVVDVRHFDVDGCCARQATRVFCSDQLEQIIPQAMGTNLSNWERCWSFVTPVASKQLSINLTSSPSSQR